MIKTEKTAFKGCLRWETARTAILRALRQCEHCQFVQGCWNGDEGEWEGKKGIFDLWTKLSNMYILKIRGIYGSSYYKFGI